MKIKNIIIIFASLALNTLCVAQINSKLKPSTKLGKQGLEVSPVMKPKSEFDQKESEKNPKQKGPSLVAFNPKENTTRYFKINETVAYKSKTDKKSFRGKIEELDKEYIKIDGKRIKIVNLIMVKKKFFKTLGWRSVGFSKFALGTGVAVVGFGFSVLSFGIIDPEGPRVIWGSFGTAIGAGIGLVGTHLMLKGSKGLFQPSKLKKEKGWEFSFKQ